MRQGSCSLKVCGWIPGGHVITLDVYLHADFWTSLWRFWVQRAEVWTKNLYFTSHPWPPGISEADGKAPWAWADPAPHLSWSPLQSQDLVCCLIVTFRTQQESLVQEWKTTGAWRHVTHSAMHGFLSLWWLLSRGQCRWRWGEGGQDPETWKMRDYVTPEATEVCSGGRLANPDNQNFPLQSHGSSSPTHIPFCLLDLVYASKGSCKIRLMGSSWLVEAHKEILRQSTPLITWQIFLMTEQQILYPCQLLLWK